MWCRDEERQQDRARGIKKCREVGWPRRRSATRFAWPCSSFSCRGWLAGSASAVLDTNDTNSKGFVRHCQENRLLDRIGFGDHRCRVPACARGLPDRRRRLSHSNPALGRFRWAAPLRTTISAKRSAAPRQSCVGDYSKGAQRHPRVLPHLRARPWLSRARRTGAAAAKGAEPRPIRRLNLFSII